jgi:cytochrome c oxidase assembly factor CtaG
MNAFLFALSGWHWLLWPFVLAAAVIAFCALALRGKVRWRWLAAGLAVFVLALEPPIDPLASGSLFSVHMVQHLLLLLIAPWLLLLALPEIHRVFAWKKSALASTGWLAGIGGMWLWHLPALCSATAVIPAVHFVQAVSLLAMGTAFWWPVFGPQASARLNPLGAIGYLFSACAACSLLGIWITFAPLSVCPAFLHPTNPHGLLTFARNQCGLDSARDQQLGGLIMWVPACLIYFTAIMASLARWYRADFHQKPETTHA